MRYDHDVVLEGKEGSIRSFRIYGQPTPKEGDLITLPVDGLPIKARIDALLHRPDPIEPIIDAVEL